MLKLLEDLGKNKLTPTHKSKTKNGLYKCSCGNEVILNSQLVDNGSITECLDCKNLFLEEKLGKGFSKLKKIWFYMLERCENENHNSYKNYGGKGIIVCDEWHDFNNFEKWAIENNYKDGYTLDKDFKSWLNDIEPSYCPESCMFMSVSKNSKLKRIWMLDISTESKEYRALRSKHKTQ